MTDKTKDDWKTPTKSPEPLAHGSDSAGRTSDAQNYGEGPRPAMGEPSKRGETQGLIPESATYDKIEDEASGSSQGMPLDSTIAQSDQSQALRTEAIDVPVGNHPKIDVNPAPLPGNLVMVNSFAEEHGDYYRVFFDFGGGRRLLFAEVPKAFTSKTPLFRVDEQGKILEAKK